MKFDMNKIKTAKLEDVVGCTVAIREFRDSGYVITVAIDVESGELFVLSQHQEPTVEPTVEPLMVVADSDLGRGGPGGSALYPTLP